MKTKAEAIVNKWISLVNELAIDSICNMYSSEARLIPTFSAKTFVGRDGIRNYFERFIGYNSVAVTLHQKSLIVDEITPEIYMLSGLYCWQIEMEGEMLSFEARFSFTIVPNDSHPIKHHHSSQIPRSI